MGYRVYCDLCGNTISSGIPNCFSVWRMQPELPKSKSGSGLLGGYVAGAGVAQGLTAQQAAIANQYASPAGPPIFSSPLVTVELCDTCSNTWLSRIQQLTEASDVPVAQDKAN